MGWVIFSVVSWAVALCLVPIKNWKWLWKAGMVGLALLYAIDSTFIELGAFYYRTNQISFGALSGLPTLYWISGFPAAILLAYYYPQKRQWQLPYILLASTLFLGLELFMAWLGYFHYNRWSPTQSYFLDVGGFIVVIWLSQWFGAVGKE